MAVATALASARVEVSRAAIEPVRRSPADHSDFTVLVHNIKAEKNFGLAMIAATAAMKLTAV